MTPVRRWSGSVYRGWSLDLWRISIMFRAEKQSPARQLLVTWGRPS